MKYTDLMESRKDEFEDELTRAVMDTLVLYQAAGVDKTDVNNIIDELKKNEYSVDIESLSEIIEKIGYTVSGNSVVFRDSPEDGLDLEDGEEYDEVDAMAKTATDKRIK